MCAMLSVCKASTRSRRAACDVRRARRRQAAHTYRYTVYTAIYEYVRRMRKGLLQYENIDSINLMWGGEAEVEELERGTGTGRISI